MVDCQAFISHTTHIYPIRRFSPIAHIRLSTLLYFVLSMTKLR